MCYKRSFGLQYVTFRNITWTLRGFRMRERSAWSIRENGYLRSVGITMLNIWTVFSFDRYHYRYYYHHYYYPHLYDNCHHSCYYHIFQDYKDFFISTMTYCCFSMSTKGTVINYSHKEYSTDLGISHSLKSIIWMKYRSITHLAFTLLRK